LTANVPLGSTAALRVSGFHAGDDTLVRNTITGKRNSSDSYGGRARLRFEPSENLAINLIGDYEKTTATGNFPFVFAILPTEDPFGTVTLDSQIADCGIVTSPSNTLNCGEGISPRTAKIARYGFSGQIDYTLPGDYVLTSITAKRFLKTGTLNDFSLGGDSDLVPANILSRNITPSRYNVFSQELRLTSPADQFVEFVAGLYYSKANNRDEIFQAGNLGYLPAFAADARYQRITIDQRSLAAFGQATIHATDQLSFIVGGRFTSEKLRDQAPVATAAELSAILAAQGLVYFPVGFGAGFVAVDETVKDENFSWRLGAKYEFSNSAMVFATASRGYKGPAVSDQGARVDPLTGLASDPIVQPEIPMSYELGAKATLFDGRLFAAVTLFHTKIKNFQTQIFAPAVGVLPAGFIQGNAPFIKTRGIELSLLGRPFEGFTMNVGAIYNNADYSSDFLVACAPQQITGTGDCSAARTTPAVGQVSRTPKFRLLLNGEYATEVSSGLTGFVQSDMQYQTKIFTGSVPDPIQRLGSTIFVNGRIGFRESDGAWSASIFARNLLGKRYNIYQPDFLALPGNGRLGVTPGSLPAYLTLRGTDQKTTYGLSVDFRF
jgi:iron complex outermembrane receptor protein